jgi:para-nitrobenzyl esterase
MMSGWVTGDGSLMGSQEMTPEKYRSEAIKNYGDKAEEFLKLFPGSTNEEVASSLKKAGLMRFAAMPAYLWAGFNKNKAFLYEFTHIPADKPGFPNYGAFHTSEVPFALHTLHLWDRPWREVDFKVENEMNSYWVNFIREGNPNGKDLPEWKPYEKADGNIMEIGDELKLHPVLYKEEFEFFEKSF